MSIVAAPRPLQDLPLLVPRDLQEALRARAAQPGYLLLAGGTDLMVQFHAGRPVPPGLIDLSRVEELKERSIQAERARLGAMTTFAAILEQPDLMAGWPLLVEAASGIGAAQIRSRATLGGNLVNASPAGDSLPPLAVYGAQLELASARGRRTVPLADFFRGYKKLDLAVDELLVAVELERPVTGTLQRFRKVGTRRAQAISKLSVALTCLRAADGRLFQVRLACGAVGPCVVRSTRTEALLEGEVLTPQRIHEACALLQEEITPIDDVRASAAYRSTAAARILARFLDDLLG